MIDNRIDLTAITINDIKINADELSIFNVPPVQLDNINGTANYYSACKNTNFVKTKCHFYQKLTNEDGLYRPATAVLFNEDVPEDIQQIIKNLIIAYLAGYKAIYFEKIFE